MMDLLTMLILTAAAFLCGSLPFSVWLARRFASADVRRVGDGNPGAANAWKAGGWRVGLAALLLDYFKGALPVGAAHFGLHFSGPALILVASAPLLGHAFSPFLGFRGGKGLTVTFGIWSGLTLAQAPLILGLMMLVFYLAVRNDAWAVVFSLLGLGAHLWQQSAAPVLWAVWIVNLAVIIWMHRGLLRVRPALKPISLRAKARQT